LLAFVLWELYVDQPMLDPRLFGNRAVSAGALTVMVQFFATFGLFFVVIQYLQFVVGRSALGAALALLPLPLVMIPLARNAPRVARRVGFRRVAPAGLGLTAAGLVVVSQVGVDLSYGYFALGLVLFAAGMALAGTPSTTAITESLPASKQGVASAVNDTSREIGIAMGTALLGSAFNAAYRRGIEPDLDGLTADVAHGAKEAPALALQHAGSLGGDAGGALRRATEDAFRSGMQTAVGIAAALLVLGALYTWWRGQDATAPAAEPGDELLDGLDGLEELEPELV